MDNKFDDFFIDAVEELLRNIINIKYEINKNKYIINIYNLDEEDSGELDVYLHQKIYTLKNYWGADDRWQW